MAQENKYLLFDGECGLCHGAVQFVLNHEKKGIHPIYFVPLQSALGVQLRKQYGISPEIDSLILIQDGRAYVKSKAAFKLSRNLKSPFSWVALGRFIPTIIADTVYDLIAQIRYKLFGKKEYCDFTAFSKNKHRFIE
jgi:predicted DCC family thiol-disulfide oxidoreductase YuxK